LHLPPEGVQKLFDGMEKECSAIKKNALSSSWYMRGGVSYEDVLNMSSEERAQIDEIVKSNLQTTKDSKLPFF